MPAATRRNISQKSEMVYDAHHFGVILDTREIFISPNFERDVEEAMIDHVTANLFLRNLSILNHLGHDPILVHLITCGGDWNYSMAIYDAIKNNCEDENLANINILAHAHARSMSSIIPQAAKYRVIMPNADFLIHDGTLQFSGNAQSVISDVDWAKKTKEIMLDLYIERCQDGQFFKREHMDKKDIRAWLSEKIAYKQEFYLTARQSVDYGFMDAVLGDEGFEDINQLRYDEEEEE